MSLCPCGSNRELEECCRLIIKGSRRAQTAVELMKARYVAYTTGDVDFIISSHDPETRENVSKEATEEWSRSARWLGIEILSTIGGGPDDDDGVVEFVASFELEGKKINHHEKSYFKKINGNWFFVDGQIVPETYVRSAPKVGRNDPCPCGSGKKYKFCCGKNR
ncbi:YchJ family protein [Pyramidobacter sp. SM-530-WT-4B]|uniref:YchJ family protein n=1 Tax=Pyramidobacter porci TaxID=2605789 RepID=A0A6L5YAG9_9BACT|nr:YchJ family protein [Pyramidobacter porci]MCI6261533.1 YchJ family protein [Pyramidobacter sp.]MST54522.1 YchJ family protein [Pyramidobacter porci]